MVPLLSDSQAGILDNYSIQNYGIPSLCLMEEAGLGMYKTLLASSMIKKETKVLFLVGQGNNGADALVIARLAFIDKSFFPTLLFLGSSKTEENKLQRTIVQKLGIPCCNYTDQESVNFLESADIWVEGLWGIGIKHPLRKEAQDMLEFLIDLQTKLHKTAIALDIPGGISSFPDAKILKNEMTLTVAYPKTNLYLPFNRTFCGIIQTVPVHFVFTPRELNQATAYLLEYRDLESLVSKVMIDAWKSKRGRCLVFAGSSGMTGAAALCSSAAQAAGIGLIRLVSDLDVLSMLLPYNPSWMSLSKEKWLQHPDLSVYDVVLVGCGWGKGEFQEKILQILWKSEVPLVIDADGIRTLARLKLEKRTSPTILTPHLGELEDLFKSWSLKGEDFEKKLQTLAVMTGAVIVAKNSLTWIMSPEGLLSVWEGRNPALAMGGSGDALAGFIAAFLSRNPDAFKAACAGVILHGTIAKELVNEIGWFRVEDLIEKARKVVSEITCSGKDEPI